MIHKIIGVLEGSICEELGISANSYLAAINDQPVIDLLDYEYYDSLETLSLTIVDPSGEATVYDIEKYDDEHLGLCFENDLLKTKRCCNKCVFCFVDQLPPGLRSSLYVKDDDWRLSVLMGNYVTLTNISEDDINRIIERHISPLYISVHTTDPKLRKYMMNNQRAGELMQILKRFCDAGIHFHAQVVLCPDINDGFHLRQTFEDLFTMAPCCESLAIIPVGLTYHRKNLTKLQRLDQPSAAHVIDEIEKWQQSALDYIGTRFIFPSDEMYLIAGRPIPSYETYEDFPQLGNGVGMLAKFRSELLEELPELPPWIADRKVSIACGVSVAPFLTEMCEILKERFPNLTVLVFPIKNFFFGESVTVSGLITGKDLGVQLDGKDTGSEVFITTSMLRDGETIFIDDITLEGLCGWINKKITPVANTGKDFAHAITGYRGE